MPAKGSYQRTPEHAAKHAAALRGRKNGPHSQETRDKIGAAQRGRKQTPEQIEKNRLGHIGQASARKGATLTEETKQKIRDARALQVHPQFVKKGITPDMVADATANGLKWCSGECKAFLPVAEFYGNGQGKMRMCIKCSSLNNAQVYRKLTPEEKAERAAENLKYRVENSDLVRRTYLMSKYGVTPEWYEQQLATQDGHCALCESVTGWVRANKTWHGNDFYLLVDHDHESGIVRGLLCAKCNTAIHRVEYVTDWAAKALRYLEKNGSDRKAKANGTNPKHPRGVVLITDMSADAVISNKE